MPEHDYVEVRDEPFHRHSFENAYARVYDVLIPSGEATLFHRHTEDTFYAIVCEARLRDQTFGEEPGGDGTIPAGISICRPHRSEPLIHRVTNLGSEGARMIGAEIKTSPPVTARESLDAPGHALRWEAERLRAYDFALEAESETGKFEYPFAGLTVALSRASLLVREPGGSERIVSIAPGDVIWREEPAALSIRNVGTTTYQAVVAEWR